MARGALVMTTLTVTATHNYTGDSLPANITDIVFNGSANTFATFAATQFGGSPISDSVHITGDAFTDTIIVNVSGTFSAAGWTFSSWSTADHTLLAGSAGADTITGTSGSDAISGEGGADTLDGGGGDDSFDYDPASEIVAGESVNGGTGTDRIIIAGGGAFDFSVATLTSVEEIDFGSPDAMTATFAGNQIGGSRITVVQGNTNDVDSLIVNGPSVDLSAVTFNLWTDGTDTITINGTSGVTNTLV